MGEYALFNGNRIKIGTCESMYYLRADQRHLVRAQPGNVDPEKDKGEIRFRFPFEDEDQIKPGDFEDFERSVIVPGMVGSRDVDHYSIQFSNPKGLLVSLPCPNGKESCAYTIHRNGYAGDVGVCQQRWIDGEWWVVLKCGACGSLWRTDYEGAQEVAVAFRSAADRDPSDARSRFWHTMADRVLAGYTKHPLADVAEANARIHG